MSTDTESFAPFDPAHYLNTVEDGTSARSPGRRG